MTKASTGTRRASTARVRAKVAKRAVQRERVQSNAGTRQKEARRIAYVGRVSAMKQAMRDAVAHERYRNEAETRYWAGQWRAFALKTLRLLLNPR
jgi:hypothetical protein